MCGIAGYIGRRELPPEAIAECLGWMRRRGPDAAGTYRHRTTAGTHIVLLHSRLAILDLDPRANQPMRRDGQVLVFNGEIYNYLEVRRELEAAGAGGFDTSGDSEVLLRLLARDGWPGLDRCEGMWAFALFDEADGTLLLSRDRFGEKPLYLYRDATGLYFGSEIKFLIALLGRRPAVDLDHLKRYLVNGYKALYKQDRSFFEGVTSVAPGSVLRVATDGAETVARYWTPDFAAVDEALDYDGAVAAVRAALIRSVELRLRADVPLAFCLSGGVDSNALIAIAKRVHGYDVHGFTIENTDARYEERDMVAASVAALGLRHTAVAIDTTDFLERLRTLVCQHDAPVYTITYYVQWLLMAEIARQGYRISVSGTGADELFSGYYDHHVAYLSEVRGDPHRFPQALAEWQRWIRPIVRNPYLQDPDVFIKAPDERRHIFMDADEFAGYLTQPWSEPFREERYRPGLLRNRMLNELFHETVPPILHEDDLNAMYFSIENRSPFLDRSLFELCQRIPVRHLVQRGCAKAVLRDAVRGIAPDAVIDNPRKVGFNAPIGDLLDPEDPVVRAWLLDDGPIYQYLRKDRIEPLLSRRDLPNSRSKFLFYFLNAKIFLEQSA